MLSDYTIADVECKNAFSKANAKSENTNFATVAALHIAREMRVLHEVASQNHVSEVSAEARDLLEHHKTASRLAGTHFSSALHAFRSDFRKYHDDGEDSILY